MQITTVQLSKLKSNSGQIPGVPKNPRLIKNDRFKKLKDSIEQNPEMLDLREPIAVEHKGELVVICGNMRLKAMQDLGYKETKVKILPEDTTPENIRAYIIKDNVGYGDDDWDLLANEWDIVELEDWGMELNTLSTKEEDLSEEEKKSIVKLSIEFNSLEELDTLKKELSERGYRVK